MTVEPTSISAPFDTDEPPSTAGLFGKLFGEAAQLRKPKVSNERIRWLMLKTHTVGKVTINLPNLAAYQEIKQREHLRETEPVLWLLESLYILAHQHNPAALTLAGDERTMAVYQYADHIPAHDLPKYMVAVLETINSVEKKNERYSLMLKNQATKAMTEISHMESSASPKQQDTKQTTSHTNSTSSSST